MRDDNMYVFMLCVCVPATLDTQSRGSVWYGPSSVRCLRSRAPALDVTCRRIIMPFVGPSSGSVEDAAAAACADETERNGRS